MHATGRPCSTKFRNRRNLGATPEERLGALATAKTWSIFLLVVTVAAAATLNLADDSLRLVSALVLVLAPLIVMILVGQSPLLYAIYKPKADPRADLSFVLMVAAFGLFIRNRVRALFSTALLWIMALHRNWYSAGLSSLHSQQQVTLEQLIGVFFFAAFHSYGFVVLANTFTDHSQATRYTATVMGKHI